MSSDIEKTVPAARESSGFCRRCGKIHRLDSAPAVAACISLMRQLEERQTIELFRPAPHLSHLLTTDTLFGKSRGKMFGILEGIDQNGRRVQLHAFSGQYNGIWDVPGWAPPLFDLPTFQQINGAEEKNIKALGRQLDKEKIHSPQWLALKKERKKRSRLLMEKLHGLYQLTNFRGETSSLHSAFSGPEGIPTGTGDCCGPKLLNQAALLGIKPYTMAEFFWGKENRSATRQHSWFYPPCRSKCKPILGFLLCGADRMKLPSRKELQIFSQSINSRAA